jgi:1-phosphofructokinase
MSQPTPPHVFTLTGNLLAERTLTFANWETGRTQRALTESFQVGGKGINVSKMLNRLRTPNTALCFTGGASGAESEAWLREKGFGFRAFSSARPTRSGLVVRSQDSAQRETTFLGPDVAPDAAAISACVRFLDTQPENQIIALCGSFPGWDEPHFEPLRQTLEKWIARARVYADVYGPPLAWLYERPVELIKINADEFRPLAPDLQTLPTRSRAKRWIVTDGAAPVQVRDLDHSVVTLVPPAVHEVSPTGSGDVLFACVLHGILTRGLTLAEAVSFALPYAAANAAHEGVAEFPEPAR